MTASRMCDDCWEARVDARLWQCGQRLHFSLVVILVLVCSLLFMTLLCPEWTSSYQYCAYEPCGCGAVVNMCFVHSAGSLVWPRWFRHRTLHFMSIHPVREIAETQKLSAATGFITAVSSCPGALGTPQQCVECPEALANSWVRHRRFLQ